MAKEKQEKVKKPGDGGPATVSVSTSIKNEGETEKEEFLDVGTFAVEPAYVGIKKGITVNLGNYESARVDVSVTRPVYCEEIPAGLEWCNRVVEARLLKEIEEVREKRDGGS